MGEDDIVELILKSGQIVSSSQTQTDPPILRGSGSSGGDGGENAPVPPPAPPPPLQHHQHIFIHEDEMASWLHHRHQENYFYSDLLYSGVVAASQPQISISLAPPPPPPPASQIIAGRRVENFTNFARLRGNLLTGTGPLIPVLRDSTQVDSSGTPSSSVAVSCLTPATQGIGGVSHTFAVPGRSWKAKEVATETVCEIAGTSSSVVCKAETEPINIRPATETEIAGEEDRKRKEREETEETEEASASTTSSRKRSRAAEMHNLSERRRREKINDRMKALQELIPRSNKSDKASLLEDAIEYVKSLQMQIQMMSVGGGVMPVMYTPDMQRMGMNRPPLIPFPNQGHVEGLGPSYPAPRYPFPAYDPSRPNPVWNQPQFPGYMNPYSQFIGLQQMQQPPPLLNQTTSQPSFGQASSSKEPEVQESQPTG